MEDNIYHKFYSKSPVNELINKLKTHRITGTTLSPEWYEGLIAHLAQRDLAAEQKKLVDEILSADPKTLAEAEERLIQERAKDTLDQPNTSSYYRYYALRTLAGFLIAFAWIVGLATLVVAILSFTMAGAGVITGIAMIIGGGIAVLMLVAISELIKLFIDIERNTRKAAEKE